jgi:copper resistance protein B
MSARITSNWRSCGRPLGIAIVAAVGSAPAPAEGHDMSNTSEQPLQLISPLKDADQAEAFPDIEGHATHDETVQEYVLIEQLEAWDADDGDGVGWEAESWVGTDVNRLWLRTEGSRVDNVTEFADVEVLYGRSVARWWDLVAGFRWDFGAGPSRNFLGIGLVGVAPYKYELEATLYVGESSQAAARLEAAYDTLLTNRLILQWRAEAEAYAKDDVRKGIGSGLSTVEAGLRLRYEFTRKIAPYFGLAWERAYAGTADLRRQAGVEINDTHFMAGVRIWF